MSEQIRTNLSNDYESVILCADICPCDFETERILLGRKKDDHLYRFFGGFADWRSDTCLADCARREMREECSLVSCPIVIGLDPVLINDKRYQNDKNRIFSGLFVVNYINGVSEEPVASDDIEEVRWFDIETQLSSKLIVPEHLPLMNNFLDWYWRQQEQNKKNKSK